jgi:hypothetical protein
MSEKKEGTMNKCARSVCVFILLLVLASSVVLAQPATHGTLVANDGRDIYDWELEAWIGTFIGDDYESMILAFTECYGGDKFDDFAGYANTALLSGSMAGNTSQYGGYHRALAQALQPGVTTDEAHADGVAGAAAGDTPIKAGVNVTVGGSHSTHVLVWAGKPNWQDQADIDDIRANFSGISETVTVLSGNGVGADGAATAGNLMGALALIGAQMNSQEQFVLFVTDHGDLDKGIWNLYCQPGGCVTYLDAPAYGDMLATPDNEPKLSLFVVEPLDSPYVETLYVNGHDAGPQPVPLGLDYDNDDVDDVYQYIYNVEESWLHSSENEVTIILAGEDPVEFGLISLESGGIPRTPCDPSGTKKESWGGIKSRYTD